MAGVEEGLKFRIKFIFLFLGFIFFWILRPWIAIQNYNRAQTCYSVKKFKKAELHYKKAIFIYPGFVLPYLKLGYLYEELNQYQNAVEIYKKALQHQPKNETACFRIGFYYAWIKKDYLTAIYWLRRAVELNPRDPQPKIWLQICCQKLGLNPEDILP